LQVALQDFDFSFNQDVEDSIGFPFGEEHFARAEGSLWELLAKAENCAHHCTSSKSFG
jgi:hypothetical protein